MSNMNKYTLYWLTGDRNIVEGESIEDAFTKAGYGAGAVAALDWYDEGISQTHKFSHGVWVEYQSVNIHANDFPGFIKSETMNLQQLLNDHQQIIVQLLNGDEYSIGYKFGNFATLGWVHYIEITYGERIEGRYDGESAEPGEHYFMMANGQYFDPDEPMVALDKFIERFAKPFEAVSGSVRLEDLKAKQQL